VIKKINYKKDVLTTFLSQLGILLITFVIIIILAQFLGETNFGIFTFILLVSFVLVRFLTLGIETANFYHIGTNSYPIKIIKSNSLIFRESGWDSYYY
jgi:O-antigen/teichoic acid export membrane protein